VWLKKYYKLWLRIVKILFGIGAILAMSLGLMCASPCPSNDTHNGKIREIMIFNEDRVPRLTLWFERNRSIGRGMVCEQWLKSYDLQNGGKRLGSVILVNGSDYRFYKSDSHIAWGHSHKTGIHLLDLAKPAVLAGEREFLKRNPQLGSRIKRYPENAYDPETNSFHVVAEDGQAYRMDVDLKASVLDQDPPRLSPKESGWTYAKDWHFYKMEHHLGRHLRKEKAECSAESVPLLEPKLIKELNRNVRQKDRVWVIHESAIFGEYDLLLSLILPNSEELARLNFQELFKKNKYPKILSTYTM